MNEYVLLIILGCLLLFALNFALMPLRVSKFKGILIALFLSTGVIFGYAIWGGWLDFHNHLNKMAEQDKVAQVLKTLRDPEELVTRLKERLKHDKKSARGWYLLGRLYASRHQWESAERAFEKAYRLKPHDEAIIINYVQCLWQNNHQHLEGKAKKLLKKVLMKNPNQGDALAMLAMDAFLRHAYPQAIDYWQRLLKQLPPQTEEAQTIRKAIAKAEQKMN